MTDEKPGQSRYWDFPTTYTELARQRPGLLREKFGPPGTEQVVRFHADVLGFDPLGLTALSNYDRRSELAQLLMEFLWLFNGRPRYRPSDAALVGMGGLDLTTVSGTEHPLFGPVLAVELPRPPGPAPAPGTALRGFLAAAAGVSGEPLPDAVPNVRKMVEQVDDALRGLDTRPADGVLLYLDTGERIRAAPGLVCHMTTYLHLPLQPGRTAASWLDKLPANPSAELGVPADPALGRQALALYLGLCARRARGELPDPTPGPHPVD